MAGIPNIRQSVLSRIWEELKHINYQQLNAKTAAAFSICLAGTREELATIREWLSSMDYPLLNTWSGGDILKARADHRRMDRRIREIVLADEGVLATMPVGDAAMLRDALLCITTARRKQLLAPHCTRMFLYSDGDGSEIAHEILETLPEHRFALSYTFPVMRPGHARIEIRATAIQNASWALFTAAPNLFPNPGQVFTVPAEAVSDFFVMTVNEIKMMFELVALNGRRVQPLQCVPELGIILGLAKLAEMTATQLIGKAPVAGPAIKGGVAFAFTSAIGEALLLYEIGGVQVGKDFIEQRAKAWFEEGKAVARSLLEKKGKKKGG
ncbi:MAG: hypothetical protein M5R41_18800 [Bacteroidia bacterium]|nr:hypothetical protein [Bacteroidia bacterium]